VWLPSAVLAESSVWKVTQGNGVLYLAGSIHVLRASDHPLPAEFDAAYNDAQQLVLEIDPAVAQGMESQQMLLARGLYPGKETIQDHLSPAIYRRLAEYCQAHHMPLGLFARFKPWLLTMTLTVADLQAQGYDPASGVDIYYSRRAAAEGKPVAGLETLEEQMNALTSFDGAADPVVANFLDEAENSAQSMGEMLEAWRKGDAARLDGLVTRELRRYPGLYTTLLTDRNRRWLGPLERWLGSGKHVLVIVGSAHVVGNDGLLAMMQARGYRVEQLRLPAK
jgi:uncharacterized protein YbaP (TraB family)